MALSQHLWASTSFLHQPISFFTVSRMQLSICKQEWLHGFPEHGIVFVFLQQKMNMATEHG